MQRAERFPPHDLLFCLPGYRPGTHEVGGAYGIDGRVECFDAGDTGLEQFDRRHLALGDQAAQCQSGHFRQRVSHDVSTLVMGGSFILLCAAL